LMCVRCISDAQEPGCVTLLGARDVLQERSLAALASPTQQEGGG
jgi:hypothetical protein